MSGDIGKKLFKISMFLKKYYGEEYAYLVSVANQSNMALDQKPLRFNKHDFDVSFPDEMIEKGESCDMVNFGIGALQKDRIAESLRRKKIYMPENVNFVHFDLEKLYRCMEANEFSQKLYDLFTSFSKARSSYSMKVESFLESLRGFPMVQEAFSKVLSRDNINYLIIGTSDKSYNFVGSESAAQKFHQLTVNHVLHDLGHATYDVTNDVTDSHKRPILDRARFAPIGIFARYVLGVIEEFEDLKRKASERSGVKMDFLDLSRLKGRSKSSGGLTFRDIVEQLRRSKKFYDVRYLVGTRGGSDNEQQKSFTDKLDFDQDIFSYIMQMEEGQKMSDVFSNPTMPKEMKIFFERMSNYLDKGDMNKFIQYIQTKHDEALNAVEKDLERVSEAMNVDQSLSETSPSQGYITYMTKDLGESPGGAPLFIFNMLDKKNPLSTLPTERAKVLIDKKYLDEEENVDPLFRYVSYIDKKNKMRTEPMYSNAVAKVISGDEEMEVILSNDAFSRDHTNFKVGDKFKLRKDSGLDIISRSLENSFTFREYIDCGILDYSAEDGYYTVMATGVDDYDYGFGSFHSVKLNLKYKEIGKGVGLQRVLLSISAPEENPKISDNDIEDSKQSSSEESVCAEEDCGESSREEGIDSN